ncbi:transcription repressor NadR [Anaerococcus sp. AGMB09787]|uniref:transcription repressor NadR n=1 Tax=Anaerococcus sp. AGMB09787 TaxID=2922869 RepID=UPI001FAEF034|nr:transcription repressor NadR [Anaerococcus sp. AGMB09787]
MSKVKKRQAEILKILEESDKPVSGSDLAKHFSLSRQVIVQDIAVLKAEENNIISTNRGYKLIKDDLPNKVIQVYHSDKEIEEELQTIVDLGAEVVDVFVYHNIYGKIRADLKIKSRRDIKKFLQRLESGESSPLKKLTSDYHFHTLKAQNEEILKEVIEELTQKNYLIKEIS